MKQIAAAALLALTATLGFAQVTPADPAGTTMGTDTVRKTDNLGVRVRVINSIPFGQPVTVKAGTASFENLKFMDVTEFKPVSENTKVTITDAAGALINRKDITLTDANSDYTILLTHDTKEDEKKYTGSKKRHEEHVIKVSRSDSPQDKAAVSLINGSVGVAAADIFVGDNKVHAGVNLGQRDGPDNVDAGSKQVRIVNGRTDQEVANFTANLTPGKSYTAIVFGDNEAKLIDDSSPQTAFGTSGATAGGTSAAGGGTAPQPGMQPSSSQPGQPAQPHSDSTKPDASTKPDTSQPAQPNQSGTSPSSPSDKPDSTTPEM